MNLYNIWVSLSEMSDLFHDIVPDLYVFLVYSSFAFIVRAGAPRKSTKESNFETSRQIKLLLETQ